ncbi:MULTISPECIES: hypothetical protein [unclassified Paenibacillus]|uniref:hypothetical protein n=1 Tax=unclassified Paenibacillus TaxID=185978 RepID=UPI0009544EF3|nr:MULTISPECIES: hypothetical protein [unclassified Paenibacillus]ASS68953.1 hypothetical protein CIC07_24645 [Paenibacillus sp. RUD330]SIR13450.1 hypothetical protein SAMN05880555_3095 [Paenibacillus sp. RU4X]SIR24182.1 hypothetical protein SAMN05880570_2902 [Paenibacillus sp. RU4T]
MPGIWTHIRFGRMVLEQSGEQRLLSSPELERCFVLGCLGPDFLYCRRLMPWPKRSLMNVLADRLHRQDPLPMLLDLLDGVSGCPRDGSDADEAVVYTLGFILHLLLDAAMQPDGSLSPNGEEAVRRSLNLDDQTLDRHESLEAEARLDAWMLQAAAGPLPETVIENYECMIAVHHADLAPYVKKDDWNKSMRGMLAALRHLQNPRGLRSMIASRFIAPEAYSRVRRDGLDSVHSAGPSTPHSSGEPGQAWEAYLGLVDPAAGLLAIVVRWLRASAFRGEAALSVAARQSAAAAEDFGWHEAELRTALVRRLEEWFRDPPGTL